MTDMTQPADPLAATRRELGSRRIPAGEARVISMRRRYPAPVEDVWDACTDPDRLGRWFMTVTGDLRAGGTFSFEGSAGGEIRHCEPPRLLAVTWLYGEGPADEVELRLSPTEDGETLLELDHASMTTEVELNGRMLDVLLNDPETGIWGRGAGWEMGLVALDAYLRGEFPDAAPADVEEMPEILALADRSSRAWAAVLDAG
jgi:uncharacterized protein YndB with AHSA1/START domain